MSPAGSGSGGRADCPVMSSLVRFHNTVQLSLSKTLNPSLLLQAVMKIIQHRTNMVAKLLNFAQLAWHCRPSVYDCGLMCECKSTLSCH